MAKVQVTLAVYRPPRDDLPHLVVVIADGNVLLTQAANSFEEGEELVDYLSEGLLRVSPPCG